MPGRAQPLVHVVVLVAREPLVVAPELDQRVPAEEWVGNRVHESLAGGPEGIAGRRERRAQRPRDEPRRERLVCWLDLHPPAGADGVVPFELLEADGHVVVVVDGVRATDAHVLSAGGVQPDVHRVGGELVGVVEYAQARLVGGQLVEDLPRAVGRAPVHRDHLQLEPTRLLLQDGSDGLAQDRRFVTHRHDHRDGRNREAFG